MRSADMVSRGSFTDFQTIAGSGQPLGNGGMQQRKHNFMMADELEALGGGTIQDVYFTPVLRLLIHVHGNQPLEAVAEIPHNADRFEQHVRQDYGTPKI